MRFTVTRCVPRTRAAKRGRIPSDPSASLTYQKHTEEFSRDPFTPEQNALILKEARDHADPVIRVTTLISGFSGLRPHELVEASTKDFDIREAVADDGARTLVLCLAIRKDNREDAEKTVKTPQSKRFLVIHSAARPTVERYLAERRAAIDGEEPLFDLPKYGGRSAKAATNRSGKWLRSIPGLNLGERQSFYSFRHSVASEFDRHPDKVSEKLACYITGHSDGKSTVRRRVYLHPSVEDVRRAVELLPNPFSHTGSPPIAAGKLAEAA
jgi:integrase